LGEGAHGAGGQAFSGTVAAKRAPSLDSYAAKEHWILWERNLKSTVPTGFKLEYRLVSLLRRAVPGVAAPRVQLNLAGILRALAALP
jgi:hypothetical protein